MKKTVTVLLLLTTVMVFFCFPVHAAYTYVLSDRSTSRQVDGVTVTLSSTQYNVTSVSYFQTGGAWTPIVYTLQIYNNNNYEKLVSGLGFTSTFPSSALVLSTDVYSNDLILSDHSTNAYWYVSPSADFAYGNGIVVPPKESLYLVCEIDVAASFNSSDNTFTANIQNGMSISNFTVSNNTTSGVYPYGIPVDMSPVVNAVNNMDAHLQALASDVGGINTDVGTIDGNIADMKVLLNTIAQNMGYNGPHYQFTGEAAQSITASLDTPNSTNPLAHMDIYRFVGKPYLTTIFVDDNTTNNTQVVNGSKRYPFYISINYNANSPIEVYYQNVIGNLFPTGSNVFIDYFYSDIYGGIALDNDVARFTFKHYLDTRRSYLGQSYNRTVIIGYIECGISDTVTWSTPYLNGFFGNVTADESSTYFPQDEYTILRDIYLLQKSQVNTTDMDDVSDDIKNDSNTVHQQEQSYYNTNAQAIEATGLQNYRFSDNDRNGIGAVRSDFVALWNACGSWSTVYVFSLTLSLALTIIRHTPKAITSSRGRARSKEGSNK